MKNKEPRPRAGVLQGSSMTAPEEANRARGLSQGTEIRSPDTSASVHPSSSFPPPLLSLPGSLHPAQP